MTDSILGVLLAGGRSSRMGGGHKCLLPFDASTLLDCVIQRAQSQVHSLAISSNELEPFKPFGLPVINDVSTGYRGPLMGVLSAMAWAKQQARDYQWIASFPTDTPFFPLDAIEHLLKAAKANQSLIACAATNGQVHYAFGLWSLSLYSELENYLRENDSGRLWEFQQHNNAVSVDFSLADWDPFFNINTPGDLEFARNLAKEQARYDVVETDIDELL